MLMLRVCGPQVEWQDGTLRKWGSSMEIYSKSVFSEDGNPELGSRKRENQKDLGFAISFNKLVSKN